MDVNSVGREARAFEVSAVRGPGRGVDETAARAPDAPVKDTPPDGAREHEREPAPTLAARVGPAPPPAAPGTDLDPEDLLRAALRAHAGLVDLGPVLVQSSDTHASGEPDVERRAPDSQRVAPEEVLDSAALFPQTGAKGEVSELRSRRDPDAQAEHEARPPAALRERRASAHFSQVRAVDADSPDDLVARFADATGAREAGPASAPPSHGAHG